MEALRYVVAALSAVAGVTAVQGWLARQPAGRAAAEPRGAAESGALRARFSVQLRAPAFLTHSLLLVAIALLLTWANRELSAFALSQSLLLLLLLYPLAVLDWVTLEVDQRIVLAGLLLRLAAVLAGDRLHTLDAVLGMLAGAGMITLAALAYRAVRGRVGLGEGDAGVLALAGGFVGWDGLLPVLLLAALAGVTVGLTVLLTLRKPLDTPIPFVPFLCAAALAVHLAQRLGWRGLPLG
jgi:prepilin signal peptidase PulO-like enzyme (type II secretory pathway)